MTPIFADVASPWTQVTLLASPVIILIEFAAFAFYVRRILKHDVGLGRVLAWVTAANIATSVVGSFYVPNLYVYLVRNLIAISIAFVGSTLIEGGIYALAFQRDKIGTGHLLIISAVGNLATHALIFANILAISTAIANGFSNYVFGDTSYQYALSDTNIILVLFIRWLAKAPRAK